MPAKVMRKKRMVYQIENRMVCGSAWQDVVIEDGKEMDKGAEKNKEKGYEELGTGIFVPSEDAYQYAVERVSRNDDLKEEFVNWFYSGNWIEV